MTGLGEVLVVLAIAAVAGATALVLVRMRRDGAGPRRARPAHLGPDPTRVEAALRVRLDESRASAGRPPPPRDDRVDELARHHAHWMSVAGETAAVDDQGRDVDGRRTSLHPSLGGALREWRVSLVPAGPDEDAAAAALWRAVVSGDPAHELLERVLGIGVGVAGGRGRLWACVVARSGDGDGLDETG